MIILPCMKRPDLDAVGGSMAFAEYLQRQGKAAKVWLGDTPDGEARFYLEEFSISNLATLEEVKQAEEFQLVDLSRAEALPDFIDLGLVTKVIDHRFLHDAEKDFPNAVIELEQVGAAATQVTEYFIKANLIPTEISASMLYGAIYSNTLCLKGAVTTERDRDVAEWLKKHSPDCDRYCDGQLLARKQDILDNLYDAISLERKTYILEDGIYGFTQFELIEGTEFWQEHKDFICHALDAQPERSLLNIIDLSKNVSLVYSNDDDLLKRLENTFNMPSTDKKFQLDPALMRKQIAKLLE
ncbi:MAG: ppaC [Alphaproteobacteria bacterium]|nr:ppaC [Alphaproteobacteria bacterium]